MKIKNKLWIIIPIVIISVFFYTASVEYEGEISDQKQVLISQLQVLTIRLNQVVNQSVRNTMGVISYVQTYPELNQEQFTEYSKNLLSPDDKIVSHFTVLRDTTITLAHPLEGNESSIGVDLAEIEGQSRDILKVKNEGKSIFVGPVKLVQGGEMLINRMPIYLNENTPDQKYYGQLSVVIRYDELLEETGITEFSKKHNIKIDQISDGISNEVYSNYDNFTKEAFKTTSNFSNSVWEITVGKRGGYDGKTIIFYLLIISGILFAIIIGYSINRLYISNIQLNDLVEKRTHIAKLANDTSKNYLKELKETQEQLIVREKLASLGDLVAGVAHEINTPLGVCVTVGSFMKEKIKDINKKYSDNTLKKSELESTIIKLSESADILEMNLNRAADLIISFKLFAVDQSNEDVRIIRLEKYLKDVIKSISPAFKNTKHRIEFQVNSDLELLTSPGDLSQVITNLSMNSLIHGFDKDDNGLIKIIAYEESGMIILDYYDNGRGILEENKSKIFDPFFTTNKEKGGSGLGMHIVSNTIYQKLEGTIKLIDSEDGVHFRITLPKKL